MSLALGALALMIGVSTPVAQAASFSQVWTLQAPSSAKAWDGLAFGAGVFAAVSNINSGGTTSGIMTSPDGVTWTERISPNTSKLFRDVVFGGNQFVAVGSGGAGMTSPDGITWTLRTLSDVTKNYYAVAYGNNTYVAVGGSGGAIATSSDGNTWANQTSNTDVNLRGVTYGNGVFVAVGGSGTQSQVVTSLDGVTWTPRTSAETNSWYDVAFANGQFVAVAYDGVHQVMTSSDGITWAAQTAASSKQWRSLTYGDGTWTAVAGSSDATNSGGAVMTSANGVNWVSQTPASTASWREVAYANGRLVAVSDNGPVMTGVWTTSDQWQVIGQSLPTNEAGTCVGLIDAEFGYRTGLTGGWDRSWQPWPNGGKGGWACVRALVNAGGVWRIDNSVA